MEIDVDNLIREQMTRCVIEDHVKGWYFLLLVTRMFEYVGVYIEPDEKRLPILKP